MGAATQFCYASLKHGSAAPFDLVPTASQVGSHLLAHPAPDGLISIEVWTVTGQVDQAQVQAGRGEVGS